MSIMNDLVIVLWIHPLNVQYNSNYINFINKLSEHAPSRKRKHVLEIYFVYYPFKKLLVVTVFYSKRLRYIMFCRIKRKINKWVIYVYLTSTLMF